MRFSNLRPAGSKRAASSQPACRIPRCVASILRDFGAQTRDTIFRHFCLEGEDQTALIDTNLPFRDDMAQIQLAQRNAFRRCDARQQRRLFARENRRLRRSPNSNRLC